VATGKSRARVSRFCGKDLLNRFPGFSRPTESRTPIYGETRMVLQGTQIFVTLMALNPSHPSTRGIDWCGDRGLFDESTMIARRRGLEDRYYQWTGSPVEFDDDLGSYEEDDYELYNVPQRERSRELTLNDGLLGDENAHWLCRITSVT